MPLVSVCIATYRRPDGLRNLLESIGLQDVPSNLELEVLVVDNDPPSAESTVQAFHDACPFPVHYLSQTEPNISLTRNVAVDKAAGDLIWFIDDDEVADPTCLRELFSAMHNFEADVVFGPVIPVFETPAPEWMKPLHARPIHPTGSISQAHRTSNTLARTSALRLVDGPFNRAYGVTGGSDGLLFSQLERQGLKLVNSAEAIVRETVPPERATWDWLRARMRRMGQNYGRQTASLEGGALKLPVLWMAAKALIQVLGWGGAAVINWRDRAKRSQLLLRMWTNVGKLEGLRGVSSLRDP